MFRLFEAHKRVQKVNQGLEDKLLKIVDKCETEKNSLQQDVTLLTKRLMEQQSTISKLHDENVIFSSYLLLLYLSIVFNHLFFH